MEIGHYLFILYLALPAFVANMLPVMVAGLAWLDLPVDGGRTFRQKRFFGPNKTWRGFIFGIGGAVLLAGAQWLWAQLGLLPFPLPLGQALAYGALAGGGALTGDLVASFLKRQTGLKSGRPLPVLDQTDYILGFLLLTYPLLLWTGADVIFLLLFALLANSIINLIAFRLGLKKTYW